MPPPKVKIKLGLPKISAAYLKTHSKESHPFGNGFLFFYQGGGKKYLFIADMSSKSIAIAGIALGWEEKAHRHV